MDEYESSSGVGWALMHGIKIPQQHFALKRQGGGGLYARGGVFAGHYGTSSRMISCQIVNMASDLALQHRKLSC